MHTAANIVIALVAALHIYFLVLEMLLWDKPRGLRVFGHSREQAAASKTLVAGVFGAITVSRRILLVPALPAAVGLALLLLA